MISFPYQTHFKMFSQKVDVLNQIQCICLHRNPLAWSKNLNTEGGVASVCLEFLLAAAVDKSVAVSSAPVG